MAYPSKIQPAAIELAALALVEEEGLASLTMRRLAARLGVQPSSLYNHYADRAALEGALARRATLELYEQLLPYRQELAKMAEAYVDFAQANPALYSLLTETVTSEENSQEAKALWTLLLEAVERVSGRMDDTSAAVAVWSFLHGYAALDRAGKFGTSGPQGGFQRGLAALMHGLSGQEHIL